MVWTVGAVQPMTAGLGAQHGYGFSVKDAHGTPFLTMMRKTKPEADQAHKLVVVVVARAIQILKG